MEERAYVYIMASKKRGTLYIGVTGDLSRRVWEHKINYKKGFTSKYGVHMLVYCESFDYVEDAIDREKQLKRWHRQWKVNLIEQDNPDWEDLYEFF